MMRFKDTAAPPALETDAEIRAFYEALPPSLRARLTEIAQQYVQGDFDFAAASDAAFNAFAENHAHAAYAGRNLAGATDAYGELDIAVGQLIAEEQAQYFETILRDALAGKFNNEDGELDLEALEGRADRFTARLRGTANESWINALDSEEDVYWVLGSPPSGSCSVCPDLADNSPYKVTELPTYPGAGETPCMFNCDCTLRTESNKTGF
jgi:hypothetical protein